MRVKKETYISVDFLLNSLALPVLSGLPTLTNLHQDVDASDDDCHLDQITLDLIDVTHLLGFQRLVDDLLDG